MTNHAVKGTTLLWSWLAWMALLSALGTAKYHGCISGSMVRIRYQHLANVRAWHLQGGNGQAHSGMWHVYMLRDIDNHGEDAHDFVFDLDNIGMIEDHRGVREQARLMAHMAPYSLPMELRVRVAPNQSFAIPRGTGVLFVVKSEDGAADDTTRSPKLMYMRSGQNPPALMTELDPGAVPMFDELDEDFLQLIYKRQKLFEQQYR